MKIKDDNIATESKRGKDPNIELKEPGRTCQTLLLGFRSMGMMAVSNEKKTQGCRQTKNTKITFKEHNTPIWQFGRTTKEVFILGGIMSGPETGDTEDWQEKEQGLQDETGNDLSNKYNNNPKSNEISLFSTLFFIQTGCCLMVCRSGEYSCWK